MSELVSGLLATLAYGVIGTVLMALGFLLVDLATPGKLRELIWVQGNRNASILLASGLLGVGAIVTTAIITSDSDMSVGLMSTVVFGLAGLALMSVAFVLLDIATPGKLGEILASPEPHPAVWVSASVHIAVGAIIAASIT
ncbi:DUF350 domain-containing protein [Kibdelosporangium philippinense]|uniref:DUF350 domain-containing protein n=1 Tax=Kibdelosporangium philippinense TaxID=211113 RepID=A0ABS8ZE70_9PSEU|nr:DUF350 domain-containing protein [Kibdelosporangium philippinense]MCE7004803.1 DUF350 domain-containing protein [Kibdelosporangium philippinense]